jgi:tellurite resistance protein TerC
MVWVLFILFILLCLTLDLGIFNREAHIIKSKEAIVWVCIWAIVALLFSGVIWYLFTYHSSVNPKNIHPNDAVLSYITGYLIELTLSFDNVFVIAVIFSSFKIPQKYQHRILFWGILGAIVFRALMILFGIALINRFHWMFYVFGVFLLYTAFTMIQSKDENNDPHNSLVYRILSKIFPITNIIDGGKFFIHQNAKRYATPLFVALIIIEITDILFALDSIPAILSITQNNFIVFSSNILAILGLRSMFFLITSMLEKFKYINYSLLFILGFVGLKMLLVDHYHIKAHHSLLVIALALTGGILASVFNKNKA